MLFLVGLATAFLLGYIPLTLIIMYFSVSVLTVIVYAFDKSKAKRGEWRIKERSLHFLSLFGGWPGALMAQELLRHKSSKRSFRIVCWICVVINLIFLVLLKEFYLLY